MQHKTNVSVKGAWLVVSVEILVVCIWIVGTHSYLILLSNY